TLKSPSYTKSVSWQHYPLNQVINASIFGHCLPGNVVM
ncbi:pilus assembly protein, partial [Escherichia coli]|nr:pilus assembly protein [Escherichia coli]